MLNESNDSRVLDIGEPISLLLAMAHVFESSCTREGGKS